jgi:hypothetical protein
MYINVIATGVIFIEEIVRNGGVEETVDIDVLLDERICPLVVLASVKIIISTLLGISSKPPDSKGLAALAARLCATVTEQPGSET